MFVKKYFRRGIGRLALVLFAMVSVHTKAEDKPHIILVMADDQGYGDTAYTGHPVLRTPHLDAMSKESLVFNRFYAGAPVCSPTRASVMTGRTPVRTNVLNHGHYLRPQEVTIAEALKSNGYKTGHFGKWHIGSVQKKSPTCPGQAGFDEWLTALNFFDIDPYMSHNGIYKRLKGQGSVLTMDAAIEFIRKNATKDQPTFTVIWFPAPHTPHREKSSQSDLYAEEKHRGYFQEITLVDEQVGRLRKELRDLNIHENTLLWYCSDNGGLVNESSGGREKKGSIYEGGLRVPSLLEWPAQFKNKVIDVPASTSDIYPTLLSITGTQVQDQPLLDGIDLSSIFRGEVGVRSNAIGFWHQFAGGQSTRSDQIIKKLLEAQESGQPTPFPERLLKNVNDFHEHRPMIGGHYQGHAALLDWPYKIHIIAHRKKKAVTYEFYNLEKDPMEQYNLTKSESEIFTKMKKALAVWQASVINSLNGNDYKNSPTKIKPAEE